jgi:hypothetical protein
MRAAVVDQITSFRDRTLTKDVRCAITGVPLTRDSLHVDHDPPFAEIARAFLDKVGGAENVKLANDGDGYLGRRFADPWQAWAWQSYHRQHAKLFLTDARANMRKGRYRIRPDARDGNINKREQE